MSDESVVSAVDVLNRTLLWVSRSSAPAAAVGAVEGALRRWLTSGAANPEHGARFSTIEALVVGLGDAEEGERTERIGMALAELSALQAQVGSPGVAGEPRAQLLPAEVASERRVLAPPPPPPVVEVVTADIREEVRALRESAGAFEPNEQAAGEPERPRQNDDRGPRQGDERGARQGDDRGPRRGGREDGRRDDHRRDEAREPRPEQARRDEPREPREPRRDEGRRDEPRRDEPRRDGRNEDASGRQGPPAEDREPRRREPEPPPEIRSWALGHPEHTGAPLAALGVYTDDEIAALDEAGVEDIAGLLLRAPVATERAGDRLVSGVSPTGPVIVRGTVRGRCTRFGAGARRFELRLVSERGSVVCRWSAPPADVRDAAGGTELGVAGHWEPGEAATPQEGIEEAGGSRVWDGVVLEAELLGIDGRGGDWLPRYAIPGVDDARVRAGLRVALKRYVDGLADHLPPELVERHKLIALAPALKDVHFPANMSRKGRARLAFDELLQVQLGVAMMRQRQGRERGTANSALFGLVARSLAQAGWQLSDAQESALDDIRRDLRRSQPMARLLQADAGAGAHEVLAAAMLTVAEGKHQVLFLCPDAQSAEHQFLFAQELLRNGGVEPVLVSGPARGAAADAIKKGESLVVFGTHGLATDPPPFRKLGLVILQEHGNFGGVDLSRLEEGGRPDVLVVTPTPVAAAVALSVYGHLALTTLPAPVPAVTTSVWSAEQRTDAYAVAREALDRKNQVLLVFPLLRGMDLLSSSEARHMAESLRESAFPGARVGIFHGALSKEERFRAFDDFLHRRADVLLATTHVENGPVIPNAAVVIIEHAEEFDIVRLHQLRALVGQGATPGRCLLVMGQEPDIAARARIDAFCKETDGWQIAELYAGQSGSEEIPGFTWAEPAKDRELLIRTRQDAVRLLAVDPGLKRRVHRALLAQVRTRLGEDVSLDMEVERPVPAAGPSTQATPAQAQAQARANGRKRRRRR